MTKQKVGFLQKDLKHKNGGTSLLRQRTWKKLEWRQSRSRPHVSVQANDPICSQVYLRGVPRDKINRPACNELIKLCVLNNAVKHTHACLRCIISVFEHDVNGSLVHVGAFIKKKKKKVSTTITAQQWVRIRMHLFSSHATGFIFSAAAFPFPLSQLNFPEKKVDICMENSK